MPEPQEPKIIDNRKKEIADPSEEELAQIEEELKEDANASEENEESEEEQEEENELNEGEEIDEETGEVKQKEQPQNKPQLPSQEEQLKEQKREAILVNEQNKQFTEALAKVEEIVDPTAEQLQAAAKARGFEWDDLTPVEKELFKDNFINQKKLEVVNSAVKDVKNTSEWGKKVDTYLDENEQKQIKKGLIGREAEFRAFAMKPTHRAVPLDILASAFLQDVKPAKKTGGSLFLTNTGGEKPKTSKPGEITDADEARKLRVSNPKEYDRRNRAGLINIEL